MITINHLYKKFEKIYVLTDINITIQPGKVNFVIGGSGSGKTVLTKIILGLVVPSSGEILYEDKDFFSLKTDERKKLRKECGVVFQGAALFDSLSVLDNIMMPLNFHTSDKYRVKLKKVQDALDSVGLGHALKKYPNELSGGMKKRVAIARAIVMKPKWLFCDEPNSGLDPQSAIIIDQLIQRITTEYQMTTIINSHDMNSVLTIGDYIFFVYNGILEWTGTQDELRNTHHDKLLNFINAGKIKFI